MDASDLIALLARSGSTLAVAESFTGGRVLDALTDVPGSSAVVRGGIVAYSDEAKRELLEVGEGELLRFGAVSAPVARAMATAAAKRFRADLGLATTGIAGPSGATPAKPVGLSFIAATSRSHVSESLSHHLGDRDAVKGAAVRQAWSTLEDLLRREGIL